MINIPDFTEAEVWTVQGTVNEHYSAEIELQAVDIELRPSPADCDLTNCPGIYWEYHESTQQGHFPEHKAAG